MAPLGSGEDEFAFQAPAANPASSSGARGAGLARLPPTPGWPGVSRPAHADLPRARAARQEREPPFLVRAQAYDGNCLFRAIADQIYGNPEHHGLLRDRCAQYLSSERDYFEQFVAEPWDAFLERISQNGEWGDDVEIEVLSEIYDVRVEIYASHSYQLLRTFHEVADVTWPHPIRLQYEGRSHYNSLAPRSGFVAKNRHARPGDIEDAAILRSRRRQQAGRLRDAGALEADALATEQEVLDESVRLSRREFEHRSDHEMDVALSASRREFEQMEQKRMDKEILDAILQQSALEQEQEELAAAMKESKKQVWSPSASSSAARKEDKFPESVYVVMSMGFPLEKCVQAYHLVGDSVDGILAYCCQTIDR